MSGQRQSVAKKGKQTDNTKANTTEKEVAQQTPTNTVTIDGKEYTVESLGEQGLEQLQNLRVTDQELQRLYDQVAITQTARNTYARLLAEVTMSVEPVG